MVFSNTNVDFRENRFLYDSIITSLEDIRQTHHAGDPHGQVCHLAQSFRPARITLRCIHVGFISFRSQQSRASRPACGFQHSFANLTTIYKERSTGGCGQARYSSGAQHHVCYDAHTDPERAEMSQNERNMHSLLHALPDFRFHFMVIHAIIDTTIIIGFL